VVPVLSNPTDVDVACVLDTEIKFRLIDRTKLGLGNGCFGTGCGKDAFELILSETGFLIEGRNELGGED
jgi:hypothetical protein